MVVPTMPPLKLYQGNYTLVSEYNIHVLYNPKTIIMHTWCIFAWLRMMGAWSTDNAILALLFLLLVLVQWF